MAKTIKVALAGAGAFGINIWTVSSIDGVEICLAGWPRAGCDPKLRQNTALPTLLPILPIVCRRVDAVILCTPLNCAAQAKCLSRQACAGRNSACGA